MIRMVRLLLVVEETRASEQHDIYKFALAAHPEKSQRAAKN